MGVEKRVFLAVRTRECGKAVGRVQPLERHVFGRVVCVFSYVRGRRGTDSHRWRLEKMDM